MSVCEILCAWRGGVECEGWVGLGGGGRGGVVGEGGGGVEGRVWVVRAVREASRGRKCVGSVMCV